MRIYLVVALLLGGCGKVNTVTSGDASCGDTTDNPANCGTCGHACGSNQTCSASECVDACEAPMSTCGSDCIDLQTDAMHCGNCTTVCGSMEDCKAGTCQKIRSYTLTGAPDPSTVFNTIAETYNLPNNLVGAIWHRLANVILVGDFNLAGYWALPEAATTIAASPDHSTGLYSKLVFIPDTDTVVYNTGSSENTGTPSVLSVATIDPVTGLLGTGVAAVFGDGFTGNCSLLSASATELLCYDPAANTIRHYLTAAGSPMLTPNGVTALSVALPAGATGSGQITFGGTFAWDGAYYYFPSSQSSSANLAYIVYGPTGTLVNTFTATGTGAIDAAYFDWSVGRYTTHDGFGARTGGTVYLPVQGSPDSQNYSPVSANHTLK